MTGDPRPEPHFCTLFGAPSMYDLKGRQHGTTIAGWPGQGLRLWGKPKRPRVLVGRQNSALVTGKSVKHLDPSPGSVFEK